MQDSRKVIGVIPARLGSTRLPRKVLRAIAKVYPRLHKEGLTLGVGGSPEESEFWSEQ